MWQDAQDQATLPMAVANLKQVTIYFSTIKKQQAR